MAWTKAKSVITVTAGLLLLAGTTTVTVHEVQRHRPQPWQVQTRFSPEFLSSIPPQVTILPTYFHQPYNGPSMTENDVPKGRAIGISLDLTNILVIAYQVPHADRLVIDTPMPTNKFDFIANLPRASYQALQNEIARQFHLRGNLRSIETNILVLKVARPRDPGLQRNTSDAPGRIEIGQQYLEFEGSDLEDIASHLEDVVKQPVINQTGLAGRFNVNLRWAPTDPDQIAALKEALLSHAGLELVAERKPVNLLMVSAEK